MNKAELVALVAKSSGLSKAVVEKAVDAFISSVSDALEKGERVTLVGFGSFEVSKRQARIGRNPQTGKEIDIAAAKVPKFRPGKVLKHVVMSTHGSGKGTFGIHVSRKGVHGSGKGVLGMHVKPKRK